MNATPARYWMTALLASIALAGCKSDGAGDPSVILDIVGESSDEYEDTGGGSYASGSGGTDTSVATLSANVLSAFFVESFEAFEEAARALRESDERYTLQENSWRLSSGDGTVYRSYPLAAARFEYAHAAGLTGAGQTVSVVDSGFLVSHEAFASTDIFLAEGDIPVDYHGTMVAGVVAGSSDTMIGVAPGASLSFGSYYTRTSLTAATLDALDRGAVAQNNSWGYVLDVSGSNFTRVFGGNTSYLDALTAYAAEGVVVFSAPNDPDRTTSTLMEALPMLRPELEAGWISVVNAVPEFDNERIISAERISTACLESARWCITGDGALFSASDASPTSYDFATGTSFVAPQVSGALALLAEAFPDLTPHDLRVRLLASADDGFFEADGSYEIAPGVWKDYSLEFGNGFIDMRAALLPIGDPVMATASGGGTVVDRPILVAGAASGDAVAASLARHDVIVSDALGADFSLGAEALAATRAPEPFLEDRMFATAFGAAEAEGFLAGVRAPRADLTLPESGLALAVVLPTEKSGASDFGLGLSRRIDGAEGSLSLGFNILRDESGLLGLAGTDGAGEGVWAAAFDLSATRDFGAGGFVSLTGHVGVTSDPAPGTGLSADSAGFASLGIGVGRRGVMRAGDRLSFGVEMPTVITSGNATMVLPTTRAAGGFENVAVDLAPDDQEMRLSLGYSTPLAGGWSLTTEAVHAVNRGHVGGERDTGALFGLSVRF